MYIPIEATANKSKWIAELHQRNWAHGAALAAFKEALAADVNYGPAHNNLGQLYLDRKQLYLAAWEFEFASKLMPHRPEPYFNLGLVYEMAGQDNNAQAIYETALELAPDNVDALTGLARLLVKQDVDPMRAQFLLSQIVMLDDRPQWRRWAQDMLGTRYGLTSGAEQMQTSEPAQVYGAELVPAPLVQNSSGIPEAPGASEDALPSPPVGFPASPPAFSVEDSPADTVVPRFDGSVFESPTLDLDSSSLNRSVPATNFPVRTSAWSSPSGAPTLDLNGLPTVPVSFAKDLP